jgi:hypothetical protein
MVDLICDCVFWEGECPRVRQRDSVVDPYCEHAEHHTEREMCSHPCHNADTQEQVSYCCVPVNLKPEEVKGYIFRNLLEEGGAYK